MKLKMFIISLFLLCNTGIYAQFGAFQNDNYSGATIQKLSDAANNNKSSIVKEESNDLSNIKGSPYENDDFVFGKAVDRLTDKSMGYYLRYNVYNDVIEMKVNLYDTEIIGLIKSLNYSAIINNKEYSYEIYSDDNKKTSEGYFILLSKGEKSSLYLKKTKEFKKGKKAQDSFHKDVSAKFTGAEIFYYKKGRILKPLSTKKKELLLQLSDKKDELNKFIKSKKVNLKNDKDLIKLMKYYDSLLAK